VVTKWNYEGEEGWVFGYKKDNKKKKKKKKNQKNNKKPLKKIKIKKNIFSKI